MNYKVGDKIYISTDRYYLCVVADENWAAFKPLSGWGSEYSDYSGHNSSRIYKNDVMTDEMPKVIKEL